MVKVKQTKKGKAVGWFFELLNANESGNIERAELAKKKLELLGVQVRCLQEAKRIGPRNEGAAYE